MADVFFFFFGTEEFFFLKDKKKQRNARLKSTADSHLYGDEKNVPSIIYCIIEKANNPAATLGFTLHPEWLQFVSFLSHKQGSSFFINAHCFILNIVQGHKQPASLDCYIQRRTKQKKKHCILTRKSIPTVDMKLPERKAPSLNRTRRHVFPTPLSPINIT